MRVDSKTPMKNGGHWHPFDGEKPAPPLANPMKQPKPIVDCATIMDSWRANTTAQQMENVSAQLGVTVDALTWIGAAWAKDREAIAFPMFDCACHDGTDDYEPCGIRLRTMDGKKFAVTGSRSGIFYPFAGYVNFSAQRVFICEGPTDTMAVLDLGIFAIGRASCRGGEDMILNAMMQIGTKECVIVYDNDGPGVDGANALFEKVKMPKTKFVPPSKDMRSFVRDGGTFEILNSMLKNLIRK